MNQITVTVGAHNLREAIETIAMDYPTMVNRSQNYWELGDPGTPSPYQEALQDIDASIGRLKALRKEIQELSKHAHEWSEDDYCLHCGQDGRA